MRTAVATVIGVAALAASMFMIPAIAQEPEEETLDTPIEESDDADDTSNASIGAIMGTIAAKAQSVTRQTGSSDPPDHVDVGLGEQVKPGCYTRSGAEVACEVFGYYWNFDQQRYCGPSSVPVSDSAWDGHRDEEGKPVGTVYECLKTPTDLVAIPWFWSPTRVATPPRPGSDPQGAIRTAVDTLQLRPPDVGVGAYVYPGYRQWGLSWWVGAPMWLWIDSPDDHQWGSHTLSADAGGLAVSAEVKAITAAFDPGDGSAPVVCQGTGTPRPWHTAKDDSLADHSPTGCEHAYMQTNTLGDMDSRYTITATVTWSVDWWSTDGQAGSFTVDMASLDNPAVHVGELHAVVVAG